MLTLGHGLSTPENSEVQAQTPPLKRRRLSLDCTIFSVALINATPAVKGLIENRYCNVRQYAENSQGGTHI